MVSQQGSKLAIPAQCTEVSTDTVVVAVIIAVIGVTVVQIVSVIITITTAVSSIIQSIDSIQQLFATHYILLLSSIFYLTSYHLILNTI